jgi:hypothetical protein
MNCLIRLLNQQEYVLFENAGVLNEELVPLEKLDFLFPVTEYLESTDSICAITGPFCRFSLVGPVKETAPIAVIVQIV